MQIAVKILTGFMATLLMASCAKEHQQPVTIALNPWPGYELLHLADSKGFFEEAGVNAKVVLMDSLSDGQRAYINGRVDGFASTVIEAVQSQVLSNRPLKIVMVPDYSNGGDVIIANSTVSTVRDLRGKRIGCEVSSLGVYILARALNTVGLNLADIELVNMEQSMGAKAMAEGSIDAFVTYPPVSVNILRQENRKTIFTSAEIPYEIVDTVAISQAALQENPQLVERLHNAWQMAYDYWQEKPKEAVELMANREGITSDEFNNVLGDIEILSSSQQKQLLKNPEKLNERILNVCKTLVRVEAITTNCSELPSLVYTL